MEPTNQQKFVQSLPASAQTFIESQLQASGDPKMGRRWPIAETKLGLTLYLSPKEPQDSTTIIFIAINIQFKCTLKNISLQAGFNNQLMEVFKSFASTLSDSVLL
ncbi:hypothetical protein PoB_004045200 [Plakobranchus ocellatus]|uniref:Uncharacterized protein n=1 Tax=Plakobranchus ocellatus TaxID=259542 RepID=A0AAV4B417_9GAST|nr:hypothetical protein PoB_004045200 [Plakobranchus ocellatus]